jgi:DNA polymerase
VKHKLYIDLETRSRTSPRKVGAYRYAEDPSTAVHCVAWAVGNGVVHLWRAGDDLVGTIESERASDWLDLVRDPDLVKVAHNVEFEKNILLHKFGIATDIGEWDDTAARSARMSLPRSLEDVGAVLGLDEQKDVEGHRVMMKLARTRRVSKDLRDEFWSSATKPEDFEVLYEYCKQDVEVMRVIDRLLPPLSPEEREIWMMTIRMNERGVKVDLPSVPLALAAAKNSTDVLVAEFKALVGVSPTSPKAPKALGLDSLDKASVREGLKTATGTLKRALELRKLVARSSVKKLHAFEKRTMKDGRIHGTLMYAGAERTLRWAGSGVQPQNFPRGMGKLTEEAFEALHGGLFTESYDDVLKAIADMLRGFFVGPFLVGDFAQIEARVLAWLAGQEDLIETFRTGGDPYCDMASSIYRRPITKKDKDERFIGKTVVLGAGYGLGGKKFQAQLDTVYDVQVDLDFAETSIRAFRGKFSKIPALWRTLEKGFAYAVGKKSSRIKVGPVLMGTLEVNGVPFAFIELPNGRRMYYAQPKLDENARVHYLGRNLYAGGRWESVSTYGGKLAENIVQATSRDLLAQAMLRLEEEGFRLLLTIHDEVVAEGGPERMKEFESILTHCPPWAKGLPLGVEAFPCKRYHK